MRTVASSILPTSCKIVVVGNPAEQQLGMLESHLRAVNLLSRCGDDLRQLRQQTEQHGTYPVLVFDEASDRQPVTLQRGLRSQREGWPIREPVHLLPTRPPGLAAFAAFSAELHGGFASAADGTRRAACDG